jgi:RNA polymerase sigma-70 factor, ECF subfamily
MDNIRFREEIAPHRKHLLSQCLRLTGNEMDADDLCQEVMIKAYTNLHQLQPNTSPKAWLVRIARNMFINDYRKKSRNVEFQYFESDGEGENEDLDKGTNDEPIYSEQVSEAVLSLPDDCQNILLLSDIYGFSKKEISVMQGIPHGTARARLFKARQILRKKLEQYAIDKGIKVKNTKKHKNEQGVRW